jgi:hypothetical protein
MKITVASLLLGSALTLAAVGQARAQSAAPAPAVVATPSALPPATASDPNLDRALLQPTAMTQPAGSLTYNNYELLLHGFTYGITDNVQATVTVLSPITTNMPLFGLAAIKWRLPTGDRVHLALQGSAGALHVSSSGDGGSSATAYSVGAGALVSVCVREDCSSLLSGTVSYQLGMAEDSTATTQFIIYGGSLVHRVTPHVKLLAEVTSGAGKVASNSFDNVSGVLASYGVRFNASNIAGDVGFIKPITSNGSEGLLLGIPFASVSYRWQ